MFTISGSGANNRQVLISVMFIEDNETFKTWKIVFGNITETFMEHLEFKIITSN